MTEITTGAWQFPRITHAELPILPECMKEFSFFQMKRKGGRVWTSAEKKKSEEEVGEAKRVLTEGGDQANDPEEGFKEESAAAGETRVLSEDEVDKVLGLIAPRPYERKLSQTSSPVHFSPQQPRQEVRYFFFVVT